MNNTFHDLAWDIVEIVDRPFVGLDDELRIQLVNAAFCRSFRVSAGEVEGNLILQLPNWELPRLVHLLEFVLQTGQPIVGAEIHAAFAELGQKHLRLNIHRVVSEYGDILVLMAIDDITLRKQTQLSLREFETQCHTFVEAAPDIIFLLDLEGTILSLNPAFERTTGLALEDWIGQSIYSLIPEEDHPRVKHTMKHSAGGEAQLSGEIRLNSRTGSPVWVDVKTTPRIEEGRLIGIWGIARDITARKTNAANRPKVVRNSATSEISGNAVQPGL